MKEALQKPIKIGDITENEIADLMRTNLSRKEAIDAIIYQRMYESKTISEINRKKASVPRGSNWFNTLIDKIIKKHPTLGAKEICRKLKTQALQDSNERNSIYEVNDTSITWIDKNKKPHKVLIASLAAIISRRKKLSKI